MESREVVIEKVGLSRQAWGMDANTASLSSLSIFGVPAGTEHLPGLMLQTLRRQIFEVLQHLFFRMEQHQALVIAVENLY
jgi:hypothetical protein